MNVFKKFIFTAILSLGIFIILGGIKADAAVVDVPSNLSSGEVHLDDHDNVIFASNESLKSAFNSGKSEQIRFDRLFGTSLQAINMPNSRWVYYSDGHNYFNGYKVGHSNYFNSVCTHSATTIVGSSVDKKIVNANLWAITQTGGYGTFKAFYNNL